MHITFYTLKPLTTCYDRPKEFSLFTRYECQVGREMRITQAIKTNAERIALIFRST